MACRPAPRLRRCLAALSVLPLVSAPLLASFSPASVGGRAAGMQDAVAALDDDVYSLYYNPAGLVQLEQPELGAYYSKLFPGLSDGSNISQEFVGYGHPLGPAASHGSLGLDYLTLNLSGLYTEETFGLAYAYRFFQKLNVGMTVKMLKKSIGTNDAAVGNAIGADGNSTGQADPLFSSGQSKTAEAVDIGTQYQLAPHYWLGAVFKNINSPNMAIGNGDSDLAPTYSSFGLARKTFDSAIEFDVGEYKTTQSNYRVELGGEKWINDIGLRGGLAIGTQDYASGAIGAAYRFKNFEFDYAMNYPIEGVQGTYGNQQVSLTIRFGKTPKGQIEKQIVEERQLRLQAEANALALEDERDRLRTKLNQILQKTRPPSASTENISSESAGLTMKSLTNPKLLTPVDKETAQRYSNSIENYLNLRKSGLNEVKCLDVVNNILNEFKNSGFDLTDAKTEYSILKKSISKSEFEYKLSIKYYRKLVKNGISVRERRRMLGSIIEKYGKVGINVNSLMAELTSLGKQSE